MRCRRRQRWAARLALRDAAAFAEQVLGAAVAQAEQMVADGADVLDIGGVSTRPGSAPVDLAEETARVLPALRAARMRPVEALRAI